LIDLRSDTVTKPTEKMLQVMITAEVGDDVFDEDPAVNHFQKKMADMFGMEAGLFVPSGTMSNQLCIKVLTRPGDEVIIDKTGHIFNYETGAAAHLSSVQLNTVEGSMGKLNPDLIESHVRPVNDWDPLSRVVAIENTTNKGGGACYTETELIAIHRKAKEYDLSVHLDGARIWNAMAATGTDPKFFGTVSDTISICFSKGLGAPVGSMLLSTNENVSRARRYRKMWGGGMRQAGLLAVAAGYAVDHHRGLLSEDHRRAKVLAHAISEMDAFHIDPSTVESNIVLFDTVNQPAAAVVDRLKKSGVGMVVFGANTIRATFHFQVSDNDLDKTIQILKNF
jgi:threonine aldolase